MILAFDDFGGTSTDRLLHEPASGRTVTPKLATTFDRPRGRRSARAPCATPAFLADGTIPLEGKGHRHSPREFGESGHEDRPSEVTVTRAGKRDALASKAPSRPARAGDRFTAVSPAAATADPAVG
jgi:hypothetical protein